MTRHETPGYYCLTDTPGELPSAEDCIEGRIFVANDRLVCGVGEMSRIEYVDVLDDYSESTVRRLLGNRLDPQELDLDTALEREGTISLSLSDVTSAELRRWDGSRLRGAEHTFAVCIHAPAALEDPLLLQLGRGGRNRGTGRTRHASLARWFDALADGTAATDATDTRPDESTVASEESTATPEPVGSAAAGDTDGSAAADTEPSPDPADDTPDVPSSGALADVARSASADDPDASGTGDRAADPGRPSDGASAPSASETTETADVGSEPSATSEPDSVDVSADSAGTEQAPPDDADPDGDERDPQADTVDSDPDPEAAAPESTWLDDEPAEPALVVKNRSDIRLRPRLRCRHGDEVLFVDDVDLAPEETHRWTDFPEEGVVHLDILFDDGSRKAEQLDERHLRSPPVGLDLYASGVEVHSGD